MASNTFANVAASQTDTQIVAALADRVIRVYSAAAQCGAQAYALSTGAYFYLGAASALGMTATPSCAS